MDHYENDHNELVETIHAMKALEANGYVIGENVDYLEDYHLNDPHFLSPDSKRVGRWRSKMVDFCYEVAEYCMSNRETVAIAMSYLDRFLRTPAGLEVCQNQDLFKLAAMTCHYMTIKIHEPPAIPPDVISEMSLGAFSVQQAEDMELVILQSIQWKVNPPTTFSFLRQFLFLLPSSLTTKALKENAYDQAVELLELALKDRHFVCDKPSDMALAALLSSVKRACGDDTDKYVSIWSILLEAAEMDSHDVLDMQRRLKSLAESLGHLDDESCISTGSIDKFPCKRLYFDGHASGSVLDLESICERADLLQS